MSATSPLLRHEPLPQAAPSPLSAWIPAYADWDEPGLVPFSSTGVEEEEKASVSSGEMSRKPVFRAEAEPGPEKIWWITAFDAAGVVIIVGALVTWALLAGHALLGGGTAKTAPEAPPAPLAAAPR